jgi:hypothetical protein
MARFGEDIYPIGRFIVDRARTLGMSRSDLVRRLGYHDIGKGHKALSGALTTGRMPPLIAANLADALQTEHTLVEAVMAATAAQQTDEYRTRCLAEETAYRARFKPHLRTETERVRPDPIFIAALVGTARLRHVELPDEAWGASADQRNWSINRAIRGHYREQHGWIASFGAILSYTLVTKAGYRGVRNGTPSVRETKRSGDTRSRVIKAILSSIRSEVVVELLEEIARGLDQPAFGDSSINRAGQTGGLPSSLSVSVDRMLCEPPTTQATASGGILWSVRGHLHGSCRAAGWPCRDRGQAVVGCEKVRPMDRRALDGYDGTRASGLVGETRRG